MTVRGVRLGRPVTAALPLLVSAALFTVVALLAAAGVGGGANAVELRPQLPVPGPGGAIATVLPDGAPVFVIRHDDASVSVVSAVDTHLNNLVVWCPDSGGFVEPGPASRWDGRGRYVFGPAPTGLSAYEAELTAGGRVRVGRRLDPPARSVDATPLATDACVDAEGAGGISPDESLLPPVQAPEEVRGSGQFVRVRGRLSVPRDGTPRLCSIPSDGVECPTSAAEVESRFYERVGLGELVGHADGVFLARALPGRRFAEVAGPMGVVPDQLVFGDPPPPDVEAMLEGHLADLDVDGDAATLVFVDPVAPSASGADPPATSRPARAWPLRSDAQVFDPNDTNPSGVISVAELHDDLRRNGPLQVIANLDIEGRVTAVFVDPDRPPEPP